MAVPARNEAGGGGGAPNHTQRGAQVIAIIRYVGFEPKMVKTMLQIAHAESTWDYNARNKDGSGEGLFQINPRQNAHGNPGGWYDPVVNARKALAIYRTQGLKAWSVYTSGKYAQPQHVKAAEAAIRYYNGLSVQQRKLLLPSLSADKAKSTAAAQKSSGGISGWLKENIGDKLTNLETSAENAVGGAVQDATANALGVSTNALGETLTRIGSSIVGIAVALVFLILGIIILLRSPIKKAAKVVPMGKVATVAKAVS